jgi:hypothetical protein
VILENSHQCYRVKVTTTFLVNIPVKGTDFLNGEKPKEI